MSPPACLDSSTCQFLSLESSCRFCFDYNNMNSSSSSSNNGFSNFNETNPVLGFSSSPLMASKKPGAGSGGATSSASNLSRPRLLKVRKQTSSHNHKSTNPMNNRVAGVDPGLGFNQFMSSSEAVLGNFSFENDLKETFQFGANRSNNYLGSERRVSDGISNVILDDMLKMKIDCNKDDVSATQSVDELPKEISKLKIDGVSNVGSLKSSQGMDPRNETQFTNFVNSEKMAAFAFTSNYDDIGAPEVEFKTPNMKSNLFSGLNGFEAKKEPVKETRSKKMIGKLRTPIEEKLETSEAYSPMNISPHEDKLTDNYFREEASDLLDKIQCLDISDGDLKSSKARDEVSEAESFKSATENLEYSGDTFVTSLDSDESSTATSVKSEDNFIFAAASSTHKKKHLLKITRDSYSFASDAQNSYLFDARLNIKPVNEQDFRDETVATLSSSKMAEEACEKWRLRGNKAYNNGELVKAEDCYTKGLNSVSENENSRSCLRAMMLCYSNRAATRISLGKMKEALGDCLMAATIDPNFLKVQVRAAHCYLAIGETENAKQQYMRCLQSGNPNSEDKKVIAEEASEGLEKAQKVSDCIKQYTDLYQRRTSEDLECALRIVNEALQISTCSEKLLQMKADSLFMLQRYEEVIQMCEQSLTSNEIDTLTTSSSRLWRSPLIVKSYFYLGKLEDALVFIKKEENSDNITERGGNTSQESRIPLADTIRELLSCKTAGNEAYKSGKHTEAVEHYTAALSCNVQSHMFASVCFCNRAAAYRSLGQITDAISDCSLAIALDPNYVKAISRRASLYEMIRDYGQVAIDLKRLVDKLTCMNELKKTQLWLLKVEEESRKGIPLNMYLILGSESTSSAADIKKAYRKAALRHHPDKAAQSLVRSDDGDDELWKEIAENVHKDADRLFKMIGEAYAVLSNPLKRSQYDQNEEMRNEPHRFTRTNSSRSPADVHNFVFERRASQQDSRRYSKYY